MQCVQLLLLLLLHCTEVQCYYYCWCTRAARAPVVGLLRSACYHARHAAVQPEPGRHPAALQRRHTHRAPPPKGIHAPVFWPSGVSQRSGLKANGSASPTHLQWGAP